MPTLDLHGEDRVTAEIILKEFLNDNFKLKNTEVAVIHGIGSGILRKVVHETLRKDNRVSEFGIDYLNIGCTLAKLVIHS